MIPKGKTLVGLAMIIIASGCGQSKPVTTTTTDPILLTRESIEFYGVTFEAPDSVISQADFELRSCPQFGCDVVGTIEAGQRVNVVAGVVGESRDGFEGWIITEINDRVRYAHLYDVLPMDATAQANITPSPTPSNNGRFELTPTLLPIVADTPLCDEPKNDCNVLADLVVGDVVVTFAFVDGDGGVWVQVNYNNVIGYVVLDALDSVGGGE